MKNRILACAALLPVLLSLYLSCSFIGAAAPTYDEPVHIARGCYYWKTGAFLTNILDHPPVSEMVSTIPLAFLDLKVLNRQQVDSVKDQNSWAGAFIYHNKLPAGRIVNTARYFSAFVWTALLACCVFVFTRKLEDDAAAYLALIVLAFTPALLSNNALVTTDPGAEVFYLAAFLFAFLFSRSFGGAGGGAKAWLFLGAAALFSALAMASKFSMAVLPVFIAILLLVEFLMSGRGAAKKLAAPLLLYFAAAAAALLVIYGPAQVYLYFRGLGAAAKMISGANASFINGYYYPNGVWWYFPYAFLVKTPLAVLVFLCLGVVHSVRKGRTAHVWLYAPVLLYSLFAVQSSVQIGIRHILPVIPFAVMAAGIGAGSMLESRRWKYPAVLLLLWAAVSVLRVHPYYLAYFNEAAGGPAAGYRHLVDSNLDWGQDLKTLGAYLEKEGAPPVYLGYFGSAHPDYYGIKYVPVGFSTARPPEPRGSDPCFAKKRLLALSATSLQGVYFKDKRLFGWAAGLHPVFRAGYSIFVYDLTGDRRAGYQLAETLHLADREKDADCLAAALDGEQGAAAPPAGAGRLNAVAVSPDGRWAAVAGTGGVSVRALPGLAPLRELDGGLDVYAAAVSPDGKYLAAGGLDRTVRLWRTGDWTLYRTLKGNKWSVRSLAFSPDGTRLASGGADGTVRLWNAADGKPLWAQPAHAGAVNALAFSPDGRLLVSAGADSRLALRLLPQGKFLGGAAADPDYPLNAAAVSPDGKYLAYAGYEKKIEVRRLDGAPLCELKGHRGAVFALAFAPGSGRLVSGGANGELRTWAIPGCLPEREFERTAEDIRGAAFSPDGLSILVAGPGGIPGVEVPAR
ncbi:MAG: phospholipid carrier-dependent glycosyltransferase [Elusimicrobia bacterium]|nr:phospholipid carrier-dependent glycosyltransferase [Elusimicrobiota bacterium]